MRKHPFIILILTAILWSCGGKTDSLDNLKDATPQDSMMYFFGIMQANNYLQDAESDTVMLTEKGRDEFIRGFREAMKMESDNDCYNKGLQLGLRLAIRLREFEKDYGMKFSEEMLADAFAQYVKSDSVIDIAYAQKNYYKIKDLLDLKKAAKELGAAKESLAKEAAREGFQAVSDTLYAKDVTKAGPGPKFKDGDRVSIKVNTATTDGRELGRQFPDTITIGAGRVPRVICLATHTMTSGQTRTFMTTPKTMFGNQYAKYQLRSDEPIIFTVKAERN